MFTKFSVAQRIQIGLIMTIAFLLVLGSNRLDSRHFSTIQTTVNSVYKDRVVVQDYIYQLSTIFHNKKLKLIKNYNDNTITSENEKAQLLLIDFGITKLTQKESSLLNELNRQFSKLQELEDKIVQPSNEIEADLGIVALKTLDEMQRNLDALAKIQLSESEQLTELSNKSLGMNILLSKLEVAFMIIIGVAILFLIFYPVKTMHAVR
ncbi:MCP four helix bundle domain-containing protein [Maribacter arenosus]|uniref:MCP four helix bundle domain-containing protein n=1 Tax=Maribacter arenosus TaxID=1854708 RepID=A0ABR7VJ83_9FLAO|nr:MCP four helix bundle domain-containing protein [Maribacter arenosus]MBD0852212.1 MCP four helix bundle domain-containing protein [Maribacter arenosus]